MRRRQTIVGAQGGLDIARRVVHGKILNSRTLLRRNTRDRSDTLLTQLKRLAAKAEHCEGAYHTIVNTCRIIAHAEMKLKSVA